MKKLTSIILSTLCVLMLCACGKSYGQDFEQAADYTVNYLESTYGEDISYNPPKRAYGVDGTGRHYDFNDESRECYYIKCVWNGIQFTDYVEKLSDGSYVVYKDCFQSVKYAYDLEEVAKSKISNKFTVEVPYRNWEPEGSTIYTNYIDYFNNIYNNEDFPTATIEIVGNDSDFDTSIKSEIKDLVEALPTDLDGNIKLKSKHGDNYHTVTIPFSDNAIDFAKADVDRYSKNSTLAHIFK